MGARAKRKNAIESGAKIGRPGRGRAPAARRPRLPGVAYLITVEGAREDRRQVPRLGVTRAADLDDCPISRLDRNLAPFCFVSSCRKAPLQERHERPSQGAKHDLKKTRPR